MKKGYNRLRRFTATLLGIVFLVSGLLKIMDPVGTMLIVTEYCKFLHLGFLMPAAKGLGIALALAEGTLGILLITGAFRKIAAIATFCMLGFFTLLTLVLLVKNPAMDCGCFGQAIHLTHLQSFLKNLVMVALSAFAFLPLRDFGKTKKRKWVTAGLGFAALIVAVVYSNTHLPSINFTQFHLGAQLYASLEEDADVDFSAYPMLSFSDEYGNYHDELAATAEAIVLSVYDPQKADWDRLAEEYRRIASAGATPLLLVASYPAQTAALGIPQDLPLYYADYKTLITLNRSNGGGSYFCDGELILNWMAGDMPEKLAEMVADNPVNVSTREMVHRRIVSQGYLLGLLALLILL